MGLDRMRSVLESTHLHVGLTSSKMLRYLKVLRVLHFKSPQVLFFSPFSLSLFLSPPPFPSLPKSCSSSHAHGK